MMPITEEGRLLILELLVKLRKEIEANEELIPVLEGIIGDAPEPEYTTWRILAEPYLNIRRFPDLNSEDLGNVYPGKLVLVYDVNTERGDLWGLLKTGVSVGWIALELGVNIFAEKVE